MQKYNLLTTQPGAVLIPVKLDGIQDPPVVTFGDDYFSVVKNGVGDYTLTANDAAGQILMAWFTVVGDFAIQLANTHQTATDEEKLQFKVHNDAGTDFDAHVDILVLWMPFEDEA